MSTNTQTSPASTEDATAASVSDVAAKATSADAGQHRPEGEPSSDTSVGSSLRDEHVASTAELTMRLRERMRGSRASQQGEQDACFFCSEGEKDRAKLGGSGC